MASLLLRLQEERPPARARTPERPHIILALGDSSRPSSLPPSATGMHACCCQLPVGHGGLSSREARGCSQREERAPGPGACPPRLPASPQPACTPPVQLRSSARKAAPSAPGTQVSRQTCTTPAYTQALQSFCIAKLAKHKLGCRSLDTSDGQTATQPDAPAPPKKT